MPNLWTILVPKFVYCSLCHEAAHKAYEGAVMGALLGEALAPTIWEEYVAPTPLQLQSYRQVRYYSCADHVEATRTT